MSDAIVVNGLSKKFRRYHTNKPSTLQEAVLGGLRLMKPAEYLWALRDVSFSVAPGRTLGVIGRNGAGKSTLLRLIGGVGLPDEGTIKVKGRIGALLDLGAGFHPDLTGRENVYIAGVISGLTRREVSRRFDSIVDFAELEEFIDSPVHTYSTGMQMRLAFAVAVHTDADVLLIDEVLSVGDLAFQNKCLERIARFKAQGCTIILVSHGTSIIQDVCDEAIWLDAGRLEANGTAEMVVGRYVTRTSEETRRRTPQAWPTVLKPSGAELRINENRFGSLELEITDVRLLDSRGLPVVELKSGDPLRVEIDYLSPKPVKAPIFNVTIAREDDFVYCRINTAGTGLIPPTVQGQGQVVLHIERLDLNSGLYYMNVGIYERDWAYAFDYHWKVYSLTIRSDVDEKGIIRPPHRWEIGGEQKLQATVPGRRAP
jgi:lipopolysaccharide transport system ATP-binding protein